MTLTQEDLNQIRDEFDEALEEAMSDSLSDLHELAHQVEWLRRDFEPQMKGQTRVLGLLCEKFAELRGTVKKLAKRTT